MCDIVFFYIMDDLSINHVTDVLYQRLAVDNLPSLVP